jgi:hypothetical protein
VEGHYSIRAEMWHVAEVASSQKDVMGGHGNDHNGAASILSVPGERAVL